MQKRELYHFRDIYSVDPEIINRWPRVRELNRRESVAGDNVSSRLPLTRQTIDARRQRQLRLARPAVENEDEFVFPALRQMISEDNMDIGGPFELEEEPYLRDRRIRGRLDRARSPRGRLRNNWNN